MELQAIRQKLQTLKSETVADAPSSPWLPPQQSASSTHLAEVTAAIESLKQHQHRSTSAAGHQPPLPPQYQSSPRPDGEWINQVTQECHHLLARINNLGQQQGMALLQLKQYLDQVSLEFERRGWDTPSEVDAAVQFLLEQEDFGIPLIEQTHQGQLKLHYHTVDVFQAEHEAVAMADALRQSSYDDYGNNLGSALSEQGTDWLIGLQQASEQVWQWCQNQFQLRPSAPARPSRSTPFTLMDGLIWFSGAAIVRALLNTVFQFFPALWSPLVVLMLGIAAIALHRLVLSPNRPSRLGVRLFVLAAGFIIGGQFG